MARNTRNGEVRAPELAYRWLRNKIVEVPRAESLFLTENEIAESSGLSRTPVREALLRLEAEGFINRIPNKGAYIPAVTDRDIAAIMQVRSMIEEWSVRRVAADGGDLVSTLTEIIADQAAETDAAAFIDLDLAFHTAIISAAHNPILTDFYHSLRDRQMRMGIKIVTSDDARRARVVAEHRAIVDAIAEQDPAKAESAVAHHLHSTLAAMTGAITTKDI